MEDVSKGQQNPPGFNLFVVEDLWYEPTVTPTPTPRPIDASESQEAIRWLREFQPLPDHLLVIVGVSYLDQSLRRLLAAAMINEPSATDEFLDDADVSTLSARIRLARCLGLISRPTAQMLHRLRKIRNDFAHSPRPLSFDDSSIKDRVQSLPNTGMSDVLGEPALRNRFVGILLSIELVLKVRWQNTVNANPARTSLMECEFMEDGERRAFFSQVKQWQSQQKARAAPESAGVESSTETTPPGGPPWIKPATVGSACSILAASEQASNDAAVRDVKIERSSDKGS